MKRRYAFFGAVWMVLLISATPAAAQQQEAAREAALTWLAVIDAAAYEQSWEDAATAFQTAVTRTQWKQALQGVFDRLDSLVSRTFIGAQHTTSLPNAPAGEYVVMQFRTYYGAEETVETVTFMREDDAWKAAGYYIK